jgi:hypothetical protein
MIEILVFASVLAMPYIWVIRLALRSYRDKMARRPAGHLRLDD